MHFLMPAVRYNFRINLMNRFSEKLENNDFEPKMSPFPLFWTC